MERGITSQENSINCHIKLLHSMENPLDMSSAPSLVISFWSHSIRGCQRVGWSDGSEGPRESSGKRELYANQFKEHRFDIGFMRTTIFIIIITTPSNKQWKFCNYLL